MHDCFFCGVCAALQPQQTQAVAETSGMAPLIQSAVLTDRRRILTKDADGNVDLWDIATATRGMHYGKVLLGVIVCMFTGVCFPCGIAQSLCLPIMHEQMHTECGDTLIILA